MCTGRSLKRSSKDVDHYFRSLRRSPSRDTMSSRALPVVWMKRSSEEPDTAAAYGGRRTESGGARFATRIAEWDGKPVLLPLPGEDDIMDTWIKLARGRLRGDLKKMRHMKHDEAPRSAEEGWAG